MTTLERLAVVESKQDRANSDIASIKKNQELNHADLSSKIESLHKSLNNTLEDHDKRITGLEETTAPLTKFRRKLWQLIVFTVFGAAFLAILWVEIAKFNKGV